MTLDNQLENVVKFFRKTFLDGIPFLLEQNSTAFLSFICCAAAIDTIAGYRYKNGKRFEDFIIDYFPESYKNHAENLYLFRCRIIHNSSPAHFSLIHKLPNLHLAKSDIGDFYLDDVTLFNDLKSGVEKYFLELEKSPELQSNMASRLCDLERGGTVYTSFVECG